MKDLQKYFIDILEISQLAIWIKQPTDGPWKEEFQLSGEAVYQADKIQKNLPITNLERIKRTRHIVVHEYDVVDREQVFAIVKKHLPILKTEVENILKKI
jgi:uncharacterized protein with HEPN domain